jgi:UDP-glucuronate decarboxylase
MNTESVYDPVNLGNAHEFTIRELAEEVARACNVDTRIKYLQLPADDPEQRRPDPTRAEQILGWSPRIQLREGLQYTIAYFAGHLGSGTQGHVPA